MTYSVTALYAGLAAVVLVALSARVSQLRRRTGVGIGHGDDETLARAIRVQGNFIEYTPFALLLILIAESSGVPAWTLHSLGIALLVGRILHATGLSQSAGVSAGRLIGTTLTWLVVLIGGIVALYIAAA